MIRILSTITFAFISLMCSAQTGFTEATDKLANQFVNSGAAMGIADMNGDGLDDIIRLHSTTQLVIEHQTPSGNFEGQITGIDTPLSIWSMCIDDLDRNGANDVFLGVANSPHAMVWADESGKDYTLEYLEGPPILPQGANFIDIDVDGDSDLFVCNDNGSNFIYRNDGNQQMRYDLNMLNTNTTPESDNSGNYASIWTDYDNDGDIDLYISKCRLGVTDIYDPRRINQLWENDGNGNFVEVAEARGLRPLAQSWVTDFADIDNDGDLDAFMLNHDTTNRLYENDGTGHFTDITSSAGFSPAIDNITIGLQAQFMDFDGDNFVDLMITSSQGSYKYFRNNGNKTFSVIFGAFQTLDNMHSFACGDVNNDGFIDLITGFGQFFNTPTTTPDKLFLNDGNTNNWSKIRLRGTNSNINGIGARIEAHGSWGIMIREVRSGVSYGVMSSLTSHFGLGSASSIDSLVIKWPSGRIQTINNPNINQTLLIEEDGCLSPPITFIEASICEGEELILGSQILTNPGIYQEDFLLPEGCDSTVQVNLTVGENYFQNNPHSICSGEVFTFPDGSSQVITQNMDHVSTFTSVNSCDSIINTVLSVLPTYSFSASDEACEGSTYTWPDGSSSVILDSQSQTSILKSQFNCDSIIVTSVNVVSAPNSQEYDAVCQGEIFTFPDGTSAEINEEYIHEVSFATGQACDSTVTYIISSLPHYNTVESDQACLGGSYTFPDGTTFENLNVSFSWTSHLTASTGCDSTVLVNLAVLDASQETETVAVCEGETFIFPDSTSQVILQALTHTSQLQSSNGCDSIIITNVTTKQSYQFTLSEEICRGDDYTFFDGTTQLNITEDLMHNSNFTTFDGCDSIIVTDLKVIQPVTSTQNISICQGDNYIFPDGTIQTNILDDFVYESTLEAANGCDSIITTYVTALPSYNEEINLSTCSGESILVGEVLISDLEADTTIVSNGITTIGCDSIFTFNITVEQINPEVTLDAATATAFAVDVEYQWFDCTTGENIQGATEQSFSPEQDGEYGVILQGFACEIVSECVNIIGTATEDHNFSRSISIFPNPAKDVVELQFESNTNYIQGKIYDINGREVLDFTTKESSVALNIETLAAGLYVTRVETEGKFAIKKFIKI